MASDYFLRFTGDPLLDQYRFGMQRFHRIGSVVFVLTLVALTSHILAVSYNHWRKTTCKTCLKDNPYYQWTNSIRHRCYQVPVMNNVSYEPLFVDLCIPNKYLYVRQALHTNSCLQALHSEPHTVCISGRFNQDACGCDYSKYTKAVIALVVLSSITLGCSIIIAHFASYIPHDTILKWLLPTGFTLLIIPSICMITILILMGANRQVDLDGLSGRNLVEATKDSGWNVTNSTGISHDFDSERYSVSIVWCFGLEFVALIFTVAATICYVLMFTAKKRPD